jgi:O-antigen ligase
MSDWIKHIAVSAAMFLLVRHGGVSLGLMEFGGTLCGILFAVLAFVFLGARSIPDRSLWIGLMIACGYCVLHATWQLTGGFGYMAYRLPQYADLTILHGNRACARFITPAALGAFFAMSLPLLITLAPSKAWRWTGGSLAVVGILLSGSKGAMLAAIITGAVLAIRLRPVTFPVWRYATAALVVLCVCAGFRGNLDGALASRLDYWTAATATIADHPFIGVGVGGFGAHYRHYMPAGEYSASTHNDFLQLSCDYGTWAGVLFASIMVVILWRTHRTAKIGYWCALLAFAVQGLVESLLYVPALGVMAAVCGGKAGEAL